MSLATNWGYTLTALDTLTGLISASEFNEYTAGKYTGDLRIEAEIKAASQAVRNYCGWHISPSAACLFSERILLGNGRIKRVGGDLLIQLPATFVSGISSIIIDDATLTDYDLNSSGIVHVFDVPELNRKSVVSVEYTAGFASSNSTLDSVKELIAHRVNHALASSNGITSEAAGGVSVTYNAGWVNSARASALPEDSKEVLAPYKLQGVF